MTSTMASNEKAIASVGSSEAARDRAKLYVDYTRVIAPVTGRVSRRFVDPGNLITADNTVLTTIVTENPMYAYFDVDERTYLDLLAGVAPGQRSWYEGLRLPIMMRLANETDFEKDKIGVVDFVDNMVKGTTGTVRMRGVFQNSSGFLKSGLFVRVRLPLGSAYKAILIPDEAILSDQERKYVWVVNAKNEVEYRSVKIGQPVKDLRVIRPAERGKEGKEGLSEGERFIVSGMQRVRKGTQVEPDMQAPPTPPGMPLVRRLMQRDQDSRRAGGPELTRRKEARAKAAIDMDRRLAAGFGRSTGLSLLMFSHFFIERPIFASVLSIVIFLAGLVAVVNLPVAQYPPITPPSINVSCNYPGANAQDVADSVAAPIEQQINGVEDMLYMVSQSNNDGSYTLMVTFKPGVDLNFAQVLVQNRINLAMPNLPDVVKQAGVTTRKRNPDILQVVAIYSPKGRYNQIYLSNFTTIAIKDEIARVEGVGDCQQFGQQDYSMRIWIDPDKLSTLNLSAADVANALREQNRQVAAGHVGAATSEVPSSTDEASAHGRLAGIRTPPLSMPRVRLARVRRHDARAGCPNPRNSSRRS